MSVDRKNISVCAGHRRLALMNGLIRCFKRLFVKMGQHVAFFGFQLWKNGIFAIILGWWVSFYFVVLFYKVKEQMFLHFRSEHGDRFPWGQPIWSDEASLVTWLQNTYQITVHSVSKGFWFLSRNIFICSTFQCFHYFFFCKPMYVQYFFIWTVWFFKSPLNSDQR